MARAYRISIQSPRKIVVEELKPTRNPRVFYVDVLEPAEQWLVNLRGSRLTMFYKELLYIDGGIYMVRSWVRGRRIYYAPGREVRSEKIRSIIGGVVEALESGSLRRRGLWYVYG